MEAKPKAQYDLLLLSLLAIVVVAVVGGYQLYQNINKPPVTSPLPSWYTQPLSPSLDTLTLNKLQSRLAVSSQPAPTSSASASPNPRPSPSPSPKPSPSPSASPSPSPAATTSTTP